jgi:hypothetical protein
MAEALYGWVEQTVRGDLRRELAFVVAFRDVREGIVDIVAIVERPDRKANRNRSPWHGEERVAGGLRGGVEEGRGWLAAVCGVARRGEVVEDVSFAEA